MTTSAPINTEPVSELSRFVDNDGVRLHYIDSGGDDRGAPLVFVPGMTDIAEDYLPALETFGRRTIVMDLRGHGRSESPHAGYATPFLASDIDTVINDATDGPIHLMTFSRGTCWALAWLMDNSERVRSLSIGDYPARELAPPPDAIANFADGRWRGTPVRDRVTEHACVQIFAHAVAHTYWEKLAALAIPTLVVRAGLKQPTPINDDDWDRYEALVPHAERIVFEDSPHDIFRPDRLRYPTLVREHVESAEKLDTSSV